MSLDYINEAFKELNILNEEVFDLSDKGIEELSDFRDEDVEQDTIKIIDMEANNEDELQDSYIGKIIVDCNVCHSHIFRDESALNISEEGIVNEEEPCPFCGEQEGFVILGRIEAFDPSNESEEDEVDEEEVEEISSENTEEISDDEVEDTQDEETEVLEEAVSSKKNYKPHTIKLLRMIGSDLVKDLDESFDNENHAKAWTPNQINFLSKAAKKFNIDNFDVVSRGNGEDEIAVFTGKMNGKDVEKSIAYSETHVNSENEAEQLIDYLFNNDLDESFNNVSIETDDQKMTMTSDEAGKVTVTTEPIKEDEVEDESIADEVIQPISDTEKDEIIAAASEEVEEEPAEVEPSEEASENTDIDIDIDEVDEESLDELGEAYLKRIYENVESFKTTSVSTDDKNLILEGTINFKSGKAKKTGFIFEAVKATNDYKVKFIGENAHLCRGKKAFTLTGCVNNKKLIAESFTYNYRAKNPEGKSTRVYGTVSKK